MNSKIKSFILLNCKGLWVQAMLLLFLLHGSACSRSGQDFSQGQDEIAGLEQRNPEASLHIHMISGSREYQSEPSLRRFKEQMAERFGDIRVTASWGEDAGNHLPEIEKLAEADLMLVFARRMVLPDEQLAYIQSHVEAGKPVLGIRTASHAFQGFLELDSLVFGGNYSGHGRDETVLLSLAGGAGAHPVMQGVEPWERPGKIYHNPRLGSLTRVLINGEGAQSGIREPLAWINAYGSGSRAFYTSMGYPHDFEHPHFQRMLFNAIEWLGEE